MDQIVDETHSEHVSENGVERREHHSYVGISGLIILGFAEEICSLISSANYIRVICILLGAAVRGYQFAGEWIPRLVASTRAAPSRHVARQKDRQA
jgi:hypothetical protein